MLVPHAQLVAFGNLNSSPHTCSASPLPTDQAAEAPIVYVSLDRIDHVDTYEGQCPGGDRASVINFPVFLQFGNKLWTRKSIHAFDVCPLESQVGRFLVDLPS